MNPLLDLLHNRHSIPASQLSEPAPNDEQIEAIIQCGLTAPDHGKLRPWRFMTIRGDSRHALAEVFAQAAQQREPDISQAQLQKIKEKPLRSPVIITVIATITPEHPKAPEIEQIASAAAAMQLMQLGATSLGFGSIWLTGANAFDPQVKQALGIAEKDQIIGFLYLGTPPQGTPSRRRPNAADHVSEWLG